MRQQVADDTVGPDEAPGDPIRASTFRSLRVYNFRVFMVGQSISVAGTWMQNVAVGWLVLTLTGSGGSLGLVFAARYLPLLVLGAWGGVVADRHDKRSLMRLTASAQVVVIGTVGVLTVAHMISIGLLAGLIFISGLVDTVDSPCRQTMINDLVGGTLLSNAIALNSITINVARIVGPGIAGLLIAGVGVGPCFLANAASYVAVFVSLQVMRAGEIHTLPRASRERGQVRAGLRYVLGTPDLYVPLALITVSGAFAWEFQVTLPLFTSGVFHGDSRLYGAALAAVAVGSIVGGFVAARREVVTVHTVAVTAALWGVMITATSFAPSIAMAMALLPFVGWGAVTFNSSSKTLLQTVADARMRGRVMSLWSIGWQGSTVIGAPTVGYIGQAFGARYALTAGGVVTLVGGGAVLLVRRLASHPGVAASSTRTKRG
jgi:MFS family permease